MAIKSDRWITEMALKHGMIEPFAENQVREGVISYGVSSYGYDIRVADEFKIFTSATGELTVVDPKNFDPKGFKDFKGDECIIPPNSFALARTIEYFRIPRDVLTICLGKSTYARCFRGDTRVALVDGTAPTLEDMARRAEDGEHFWGYSIGPFGQVLVTLLEAPRFIGRDRLIEITLDNGEPIACTPDHLFLTRNGRMVEAGMLRPGDSLMPLYRSVVRGYEQVYQPIDGHLYSTHRLSDDWNIRHGIYEDQPGTHRHHVDHDRRNNRPWNLIRMNAGEHVQAVRGAAHYLNHKVAAIRDLGGDHDVYCLTVPEAGNFALEAGVFVHNCGIIVNVTPFEPEWEGFVTIEISNTTPLPAKIYANEGIAQVLFFGGEEPPLVSYRDRKGKYQGQQGVTLPKM
jgi:deoxycytidine triphosphate deaminase